jgi:hypothetical protein
LNIAVPIVVVTMGAAEVPGYLVDDRVERCFVLSSDPRSAGGSILGGSLLEV